MARGAVSAEGDPAGSTPSEGATTHPMTDEALMARFGRLAKRPKAKGGLPTLIRYDTGTRRERVYAFTDIPAPYIEECFAVYAGERPDGTDEGFLCMMEAAVHRHVPARMFREVTILDMDALREAAGCGSTRC